MRTIADYEIVNHGVDNSQYFQGCGTAFTDYDDVYTGIGSSAAEALDDALEQAAMSDWETETVTDKLSTRITIPDDAEDCYHYVSIRVAELATDESRSYGNRR